MHKTKSKINLMTFSLSFVKQKKHLMLLSFSLADKRCDVTYRNVKKVIQPLLAKTDCKSIQLENLILKRRKWRALEQRQFWISNYSYRKSVGEVKEQSVRPFGRLGWPFVISTQTDKSIVFVCQTGRSLNFPLLKVYFPCVVDASVAFHENKNYFYSKIFRLIFNWNSENLAYDSWIPD